MKGIKDNKSSIFIYFRLYQTYYLITELELHFNEKLACTSDMYYLPYYDWLPVPTQVNEFEKCIYWFISNFLCSGNYQITCTAMGSLMTSNISLHLFNLIIFQKQINFSETQLSICSLKSQTRENSHLLKYFLCSYNSIIKYRW